MYKSKHYEEEGVLMNRKSRTLLVVFELLSRHLVLPSFEKLMSSNQDEGNGKNILVKIQQSIKKYFGTTQEIIENV